MTKLLPLLLVCYALISGPAFAQVPVMSPISGPSSACGSPSTPKSYSTSATNSPFYYTWGVLSPSTGVVISNPSQNVTSISFPNVNATYTFYCTATNQSGTSSPVMFVVTVFQTPMVTFSGGGTAFCQGSSTNLSASPTIGSQTITYSWTPSSGLNTTTSGTVIATPPATTQYTVLLTLGSCTNNVMVTVTVNALPSVTAVSNRTLICAGEKATVTIGGSALTYSNGTTPLTGNFTIAPSATKSYTVRGQDASGCIGTATLSQSVDPCVGIRSIAGVENNGVTIYPNPSNGSFIVTSGHHQTLIIINALGQTVREIKVLPYQETKISGLPNGVYYLFAGKSTTKIIITD